MTVRPVTFSCVAVTALGGVMGHQSKHLPLEAKIDRWFLNMILSGRFRERQMPL